MRDIFRQALGDDTIQRSYQSRGGHEGADVLVPGLHVECKFYKQSAPIMAAYKQACRDATEGNVPVAYTRVNGGRWLATLDGETFAQLWSKANG